MAEIQLTMEQVAGLKRLVANPEWKTCLGLWHKLTEQKETGKSNRLRAFDLNGAVYNQGYVDGVRDIVREVEKHAKPKYEQDEQPYS